MKYVLLLLSASSCLLSSCAINSGSAIRPETQAALKGARIAAVYGNPPAFHVTTMGETFGAAMTGIAAGAASGNPNMGAMMAGQQVGMQASQNKIAAIQLSKDLQLPDPAATVARSLVASLAQRNGMVVVPVKDPLVPSDRPSVIAKSASGADYVLKVTTVITGAIHGLTNPTKYHLIADIRMQLIDARTGKEVLSGRSFTHDTSSKATTTTYDGVLADNAAFVRQELAKFQAVAEQHFRKNILKL